MLEADTLARIADEAPPSQGHARFDADPRPHPRREHLLLI